MKNIYTLIYSLNNVEKDEDFLLELSEISKKELLLKGALDGLDFSPRKEIVDRILKYTKEA